VLQRKTGTSQVPPNPQLQRGPTVPFVNRPQPAPKVSQPQLIGSRQPSAGRANHQTVSPPVARALQKKIVQPQAAPTPKPGQSYLPNQAARRNPPVIQRTIEVQNVDYDPVTTQYRDGIIHPGNFFNALRTSINDAPAFQGYRNQLNNVIANVSGQNFSTHDVDTLTATITTAVRNAYQGHGQVINSNNLVATLTDFVRTGLVGNIQPDHRTAMTQGERNAFDGLAQAPSAVLSRAKGVPNTISYANLPNAVKVQVAARLTEIRNERARWNVAAIEPEYTLPDSAFSMEICGRQRGLHYQGNHSTLAGWLPAVGAPVDRITPIGNAIYNQASPGLQRRLTDRDPLRRMDYAAAGGQARPNRYRTEYEQLRAVALNGINDQAVKLSAMAALCAGISAYIEFSMGGDISRLMYDPVNFRVYICAQYKWRQGYNPFFQVLNFPAV
jgi:hypothetical protein